MPTRSYKQQRPYGEPSGLRLIAQLESAGTDPFSFEGAQREADALGVSRSHTQNLLNELTIAGRLTRIKRGLYAINDPLTKQPRAHPFAIGATLVTPAAVSHWSALQHWGLTEQIPAAVTLSSPSRTFPPAAEASSDRRA
jgi:predicted transcriptional regulator of viral defense system